jgi:hypothetical protein
LIEPSYVPGPVLVLGWILSVIMVMKQRHGLNWRRVFPAIVARLPGSWCGVLLLVSISSWQLSFLFGAVLLVATWLSWRSYTLTITTKNMIVAGFFSGLLGTTTSIGGPPMALLYQRENRLVARNEIAAFFLVGTPLSIALVVFSRGFELLMFPFVMKMLPGVLGGVWLYSRLEMVAGNESVRGVVFILSALSAVGVLCQGMLGLF